MNEAIDIVKHGDQEVKVLRELQSPYFTYQAVGMKSLPLAVDLAVDQARKMRESGYNEKANT